MSNVKPRRRYDSTHRQETARRRRLAILDAAERRFLSHGYASTTIAAIAQEAGVSAELIYKAYGGKGGMVKAIYDRRLAGTGPVPAYQRSDEMREQRTDPKAILHEWGLLTAEVAATLTPIRLLLRSAATTDADMARVLEQTEKERLDRMRHHAEFLAERGYLRPHMGVDEATDVLWVCSSTELYELLVIQRGWSPPMFAQFITDFMSTGLLRPNSRGKPQLAHSIPPVRHTAAFRPRGRNHRVGRGFSRNCWVRSRRLEGPQLCVDAVRRRLRR